MARWRSAVRILTQPFFFPEPQWIETPSSWKPNIVSFRSYGTGEPDGLALWEAVQERLTTAAAADSGLVLAGGRYGAPCLVRPRLGQGGFRLVVTDAYNRRCAVTGERTLPALEAAHIRPYAEGGEHAASNGILLRRDVHSLFDAGYVTVSADLDFEVSRRIREEFENGRQYYDLHGAAIMRPKSTHALPDSDALQWHREIRYLG